MAHKLPPIYAKSFVGIWKRKYRSGRQDHKLVPLIFNADGTATGPLGPGSRKVNRVLVIGIKQDPNSTEKGVLTVQYGRRPVHWNYTLNRNNQFKADFHPIGPNKIPPVLNELLLVGEGARHLYAFLSHPFRRIVTPEDIMGVVEP